VHLEPNEPEPTTHPVSYLPASTNVGDAVTIRFARSDIGEHNVCYCSQRTRYIECFSDIDDFFVKNHAFSFLVNASVLTRNEIAEKEEP